MREERDVTDSTTVGEVELRRAEYRRDTTLKSLRPRMDIPSLDPKSDTVQFPKNEIALCKAS